ncbi:D-alanyl-D-alanine carboxypeptidase [Piscinibacter sp. XHJ-5]|uniref:D-alanyl-D-alanine carboxypeptidase/D-alanyl-D-alanine-endopeptidase n=1 Tax=Piscinibacter sp. XHJ-5 TaxID=3037797 RepID=UPI002452D863|nr:D-alanyl-D-alanine carboxypeptidase [Piscinibacter sp. XHJ-5]
MQHRARTLWLGVAVGLCSAIVQAAPALPTEVAKALGASGLPLASFGFDVRPVDAGAPTPLATLNAERPFTLGSTAKIVTSLAALDLLGEAHRWRTEAYAAGPLVNGRLAGDLVIAGGDAGLTPTELARWFRQMRAEGLVHVAGNIVLERLDLLHEEHPTQAGTAAEERATGMASDARTFNRGALVVAVHPTRSQRAAVTLRPHPLGVQVVNDVFMGGGCQAWAQWKSPQQTSGLPTLWVRGRWDDGCGARDVAFVRPTAAMRLAAPAPAVVPTPRLVTALWAQTGGKLGGRVVEAQRRPAAPDAADAPPPAWSSEVSTPLPELIREINKTSNNVAARNLLLSLASGATTPLGALSRAQERVHGWLREKGLADDDIHIDIGSGQSRAERGKPRAMVQLLLGAWRAGGSTVFVDSLPIAGVDGTLAQRMRSGSATGQAWLKTGTLRDTRALAGYVRARSGKVYAVAAIVNHPQAARATPSLDAFIEWVAKNG